MNDGIMILTQQSTYNANLEKRPLVSENPKASPSGVDSIFPEKVIMDIRNGITSEVLMGYG